MLKARVVTALLLLAGFLATLFLLPFFGWILFVSAVAGVGAWEWGGLLKLDGALRFGYAFAAMALCAALGWIVFDSGTGTVVLATLLVTIFLVACVFWMLAVPVWLGIRWAATIRFAGLATGLVILIPACLALMHLRTFSPLFLLAAMATVWVADISAYVIGRKFGRHKLALTISPGKTWEGAAGAVAGVMIYGVAVAWSVGRLPNTMGGWMLFSLSLVVLTAVSILGDLFESLIKRQAGVKDSGTLLPGHGGVLDRIDSLTSTLPLVGLAVLYWEGQLP
ncbi:MAG: phosphatidate cytidylyltransferase [Betaproteobacteria bacterium HGW-Betaproteobacteria-14]|nr:MAG: phosphatidate cytidylyltransferase [Betaproteobacteria bacterium HGW-Betaproteobacteria-14]